MSERIDQWPRAHSCLNSWCPAQRPECVTCDEVCLLLINEERQKRAKMNIPTNHVDDRTLVLADGRRFGPFSSHWAGCAAMVRLHDPKFRSIGGDKLEDLAIERSIVR